MKIKLKLSANDFKKRAKELNAIAQKKDEIVKEFLLRSVEEIKLMSSYYLEQESNGLSSALINDINSNWETEITGNRIQLINNNEFSAFLEFGTGIVGNGTYNTVFGAETYQYDVEGHKLKDRSWIFKIKNENMIDIKPDYIINRTTNTIRTKGQPAIMYLFNAVMSLVEKDVFKNIWNEVIEKKLKEVINEY